MCNREEKSTKAQLYQMIKNKMENNYMYYIPDLVQEFSEENGGLNLHQTSHVYDNHHIRFKSF